MNIISKVKKNFNKALTIFLVLGIIVLLNFFAFNIFYHLDFTTNKIYSISAPSKNAVKKLDDIVNVKVYFSKDLPPQFLSLRQDTEDILKEYSSYSNNFKYKFIDPGDGKEAEELGIPKLQFNNLEKDKLQVVNGYLGMVISYGEKSEIIPVVENTSNLEYQITTIIKKITSKNIPVIGFVSGEEVASSSRDFSYVYKKIKEIYSTKLVDLKKDKLDESIRTLVIVGAKKKFNQEELKKIDKFFINGGSLLVLQDGVNVDSGLMASKNENNLNDLLNNYGLKINNDLILDNSNAIASFNQGIMTYSINYPFWIKALNKNFDQTNPISSRLESLVLPWVSSLNIDQSKLAKDSKISYLVKSSEKAWKKDSDFNLDPEQYNTSNSFRQFDLAVYMFGKFNSAFDKGVNGESRLIVISDSDFINDNFIQNNEGNLLFFQNSIDSLSLDEDLINIRSKNIIDRPIKNLSDAEKNYLRYMNVFGFSIIILIVGIVRYFIRKKNSKIEL